MLSSHLTVKDPVLFLVNRKDQYGVAPLHLAVQHTATTKLLVTHHADVNIGDSYNVPPLHLAVDANNVESAAYLLENGSFLESRNFYGESPLQLAAVLGKLGVFELLVERGADVQSSRWGGNNVLSNCCHGLNIEWDEEHAKILLLLLRLGLDPDRVNIFDIAPTHRLLPLRPARFLFISRTLSLERTPPIPWTKLRSLTNGALFDDDKFPLIVRAYGKETLVRVMNLHISVDPESSNPLCLAASEGSIQMMRNLILIGADIEFEGCKSGTALMAACKYGRIDVVKFFIRHGARLSYSCDDGAKGRLPLYRSALEAARNHPDVLQFTG